MHVHEEVEEHAGHGEAAEEAVVQDNVVEGQAQHPREDVVARGLREEVITITHERRDNSISFAHFHVRPMGVRRTCRRVDEIKMTTHSLFVWPLVYRPG